MKLFIDDIRTPPDDSWHICRSVSAAIRAIDMFGQAVTDIQLDHDISHQVVIGKMSRPYPCEETFEAVARHIALYGLHVEWQPNIKIHTSNPVGAENMKKILEEAGFLHVSVESAHGANRLETIL